MILSDHVAKFADQLASNLNSPRIDKARKVLDQASLWPRSAIRGDAYAKLAGHAVRANDYDTAFGILFDNDRLFTNEPIQHLVDVPEEDHMTQLLTHSGLWLSRVTPSYAALKHRKMLPMAERVDTLSSRIGLYLDVIALNCPEGMVPEEVEDEFMRDFIVRSLKSAKEQLMKADDMNRAKQLAWVDPRSPSTEAA